MRRLREILDEYGRLRKLQIHCLSLNDFKEEPESHFGRIQNGHFIGCSGNKVGFALKAIELARNYPNSSVVVGHLHLSPVAWGLKKMGFIRSYILVTYGIEAWREATFLDQRAARCATYIVTISDYTAREFCSHNGIPRYHCRIVPPSLSEEEIGCPTPAYASTNAQLKVLTVGRLSTGDRNKGIDFLIRGVAKVHNDGINVHLTVVGDGDGLPRLQELAATLGLSEKMISFLGIISDKELDDLYRDCGVFAMPSKKEGFGIVFLEAMRFGKPCIGGNHGAIPEIIKHGVNGYLVDYGNVDQLACYLGEFFRSPRLRHELGQRGYEKVKDGYLFTHMQAKWFAVLDELNRC